MAGEGGRAAAATGAWETVVGLETHARIVSRAKLFSGASAAYGAAPNAHVSPVDAAMPGMLPVVNMACIEQAVRTGLALGGKIAARSLFDRKNYFYPDLPAGYQISQYGRPLVRGGRVEIELAGGGTKTVAIERLHVEQDAGKSLHDRDEHHSWVDLNRAGTGLMEIVSRPEMSSPEEAAAYVRKLRTVLRYAGTCDGNMQEGSLRVDANVSVRRPGGPLGTRCEIKNLNSMRFLQRAIAFEAARQVAVLEVGGSVRQETRLFDAVRGETRSMRSKEEAHDYGTVSGRIAKDVFAEMFETGRPAAVIVEEKGLKQVTDAAAIEAAIDEALAQHADKVAEYRAGKAKLFGFFVGQAMRASGGKANPRALNELLRRKLDG